MINLRYHIVSITAVFPGQHVRVTLQRMTDGVFQATRALAMNNAHPGHPCHLRLVQKGGYFGQPIFHTTAANIQF